MINKSALLLILIPSIVAASEYSCGQPKILPDVTRIVGGTSARPYSWPWQGVFCGIGYPDPCSLKCGCSLLNERWAMTAAHCVYMFEDRPEIFSVKFGTYKWQDKHELGAIEMGIKSIHRHPNFSHPLQDAWDIALLELKQSLNYTDHISPICLPSLDNDVTKNPGTPVWVTGWGKLAEHEGRLSADLQQVRVPVVAQEICDQDYNNGRVYNPSMFCAGMKGKDSCQGDSGGPLVSMINNIWHQYGIVSWGKGCAEPGKPGVYSKVSAYCDYIKDITKGELKCPA